MDSGCELGCFGSVLLTQNIGMLLNLVQVSTSFVEFCVQILNSSSFGWIQGYTRRRNGRGLEITSCL
jgi:hypothetical protein